MILLLWILIETNISDDCGNVDINRYVRITNGSIGVFVDNN